MKVTSRFWLNIAIILTGLFSITKLLPVFGPPIVMAFVSQDNQPFLSKVSYWSKYYIDNTAKTSNLSHAHIYHSFIASILLGIGFLVSGAFLFLRKPWAKYLWIACFLLLIVNYMIMLVIRNVGFSGLHMPVEATILLLPSLFILTRKDTTKLLHSQ